MYRWNRDVAKFYIIVIGCIVLPGIFFFFLFWSQWKGCFGEALALYLKFQWEKREKGRGRYWIHLFSVCSCRTVYGTLSSAQFYWSQTMTRE